MGPLELGLPEYLVLSFLFCISGTLLILFVRGKKNGWANPVYLYAYGGFIAGSEAPLES